MHSSNREAIRLGLRMEPRDVQIYYRVVQQHEQQSDVAKETGLTRARISQICAKATKLMLEWKDPSEEIARELPTIEAEACAGAGITTIDALKAAVIEDRIPRWWPGTVVACICRRYGIAVPGSALRKAYGALMEILVKAEEIGWIGRGVTGHLRDIELELQRAEPEEQTA